MTGRKDVFIDYAVDGAKHRVAPKRIGSKHFDTDMQNFKLNNEDATD